MASTSPIKMVRQVDERYLINTSDHGVRKLVYAIGHQCFDICGAEFIDIDPHYELYDLPAHSHTLIADVASDEMEMACWCIEEIVWDDGTTSGASELQPEEPW